MALLTYLFAFAHFSSEILIFRTAKINIPVLSPVVVASAYHLFVKDLRDLMIVLSHDLPPSFFFFIATSLVWMILQYDFYVKA
jgi:Erg28 like protein